MNRTETSFTRKTVIETDFRAGTSPKTETTTRTLSLSEDEAPTVVTRYDGSFRATRIIEAVRVSESSYYGQWYRIELSGPKLTKTGRISRALSQGSMSWRGDDPDMPSEIRALLLGEDALRNKQMKGEARS